MLARGFMLQMGHSCSRAKRLCRPRGETGRGAHFHAVYCIATLSAPSCHHSSRIIERRHAFLPCCSSSNCSAHVRASQRAGRCRLTIQQYIYSMHTTPRTKRERRASTQSSLLLFLPLLRTQSAVMTAAAAGIRKNKRKSV